MRRARIFGNYVQKLASEQNISTKYLAETLGCTENEILKLYKGFTYPSFAQLSKLSEIFSISVESLLKGDISTYRNTVVHCVNDFDKDENREMILDMIEYYVDIYNSVHKIQSPT